MTTARDPAFVRRLREVMRGDVREAELLARYSTYRIGGPATVALPGTVEDVAAALRLAAEAEVPVFPLGLGSIVLLPDEGLEALVLRLGEGLDYVEAHPPDEFHQTSEIGSGDPRQTSLTDYDAGVEPRHVHLDGYDIDQPGRGSQLLQNIGYTSR